MILRLASSAAFLVAASLSLGTAATAGPAQSYEYQQPDIQNACPPPLKFAAGACVRRCPAGYRNNGRTCGLKSMRH